MALCFNEAMMSTFNTQRRLSASPSAVFDAIRDAKRLAKWWGPSGFTNTFDVFEFQTGGRWHFNMTGPDGKTYPNQSVFSSIEADRQVVIDHVNHPHFQLKITLEPVDGGTLLSWSQTFADANVAQALSAMVTTANEQNLDRLESELNSVSNHSMDLHFQRDVAVPKGLVWRAWTEPALLMQWFCPRPWQTIACEIDLRPGGVFKTTMQSPEGMQFPNSGTYLEVLPNQRLVWTNALLPGFRPVPNTPVGESAVGHFHFTAIIELADLGEQGTRYTATVLHGDEASCKKHEAMGFETGWGIALDQMVSMIQQGI
jgi:uncharacterized protein YndB with AHSA1/START domain